MKPLKIYRINKSGQRSKQSEMKSSNVDFEIYNISKLNNKKIRIVENKHLKI